MPSGWSSAAAERLPETDDGQETRKKCGGCAEDRKRDRQW